MLIFNRSFVNTAQAYLSNHHTVPKEDTIDRRYYYEDRVDNRSFARSQGISCGIAREALAYLLRENPHTRLLPLSWHRHFFSSKDPSVLGLLEQFIIASIIKSGLQDVGIPPNPEYVSFTGDITTLNRTGFYVPVKPRCRAIDAIWAQIDPASRTAYIVPIQNMIGKHHSDSEFNFFRNWDRWSSFIQGYEAKNVKVTFVWIVEEKPTIDSGSVEVKSTTLRSGKTISHPVYR